MMLFLRVARNELDGNWSRLPGLLRASSRILILLLVAATASGCASGGEHERGSEDPELDDRAMSLRLDRNDLAEMYNENFVDLIESDIMAQWKAQAETGEPPVVAMFPIRNETSEHIREPLDTFLSKFENQLVKHSPVKVVDRDRQEELMREVKRQQSAAFDASKLSKYGSQLGAQYYMTGKAYDVAERTETARRVQYFLFLQVLNVETGAIEFQMEAKVTKGLIS